MSPKISDAELDHLIDMEIEQWMIEKYGQYTSEEE